MKTRILSSIFIVCPLLLFLFFGGVPLLLLCFAISAVGIYEFYKGYEKINVHAGKLWAYGMLAALYIIVFFGEFTGLDPRTYNHILSLWVFGTVCLGLLMTLIRKDHNILDGPITSLGLLYIGYFNAHLVLIDSIEKYSDMVWLVILAAFGCDTFAYFTGYFLGKHKMAPNISPKKTWEGAAGGILGSVICCGVFGWLLYGDLGEIFIHCMVIGFFGALFGMAGDLIASAFKRKMGIKDYGNLIPGHGGILDRFDSVILVAPFVYYYILIFIRP
jgi:phosphatidate cytidylyltransferase